MVSIIQSVIQSFVKVMKIVNGENPLTIFKNIM